MTTRRQPPDEPPGGHHDLLDLPLGEGEPESGPAAPPAGAAGGERAAVPPPPAAGAAAARRRTPWLWLALALVGVVAAVAAGYLLRRDPPVARASASLVDLGEQRLGEGAPPGELAVENAGGRRLEVTALTVGGEAAGEFTVAGEDCTGRRLAAGESCTVRLAFAPAAEGPRQAVLEVAGNAANSPLAVPLVGAGTAPRLEVEPARLDFGDRPLGSTSPPQRLTVSNRGSAPLRVSELVLDGAAAEGFRVSGCAGRTLAPEASCTAQVVFAPRLEGDRRASLRLLSDAPGPPPLVWLVGSGRTVRQILAFEPDGVDFGEVVVGTAAPPRRLRLVNRAEEPVRVESLRPAEAGAGFRLADDGCSGAELAPGEGCEVAVTFTAAAAGRATTPLRVGVAGAEADPWVELAAVAVEPSLELRPARLDFGEVRVGRPAAARRVEVRNTGAAAAAVPEALVAGADAGAFALAGGCAGRTLAPGARCRLEVTFRPPDAGARTARLELPGAAGAVELAGSGVEPRLGVDLEGLVFGTVQVGSDAERSLGLRNLGSAELTLADVSLAGDDAGDFRLAAGGCVAAGRLPPGGECQITVRYRPRAAGASAARLVVDHDAARGHREWPLSGVAEEPPRPEIRVSPPALRFGAQPLGERSGIADVELANPGTGRLLLGELSIEGPAAGDFRLVPGSCAGAGFIAPGGDCSVGVRFVPAAAGARRARLVVRHNAAGGRTVVALEGAGAG